MPKKITRKEDAASIVGPELAEELETKSKATAMRSDAIIEMSETKEETEELIAEIEAKEPEVEESEPQDQTVSELSEASVEKFEDSTMANAVNSPAEYVANLPYGGATSMKDAENYVEAKNEAIYLMDMWSVFSNVVWNIMDRSDVEDKRSALNAAVDEFKNVLTAKAMVAFSVVEKSEPASVENHELQSTLDVLLDAIDNSLQLDSDVTGKLNSINPALQELGQRIRDFVVSKSEVKPVPQNPDADSLVEIKEMLQSLTAQMGAFSGDLNTLKSQVKVGETKITTRIPAPRTLRSEQVVPAQQPVVKSETPRLSDIIRKSVGL